MCAVAFTFEAFASSVHHHLPRTKLSGRSADARIHQTLSRAFKMNNAQSKLIRSVLQQIFRFRDRAVHPSAAYGELTGHPVFRTGMEPMYLMYRVENAATSCAAMHQSLWHCLMNPRGQDEEFIKWCDLMATHIGKPIVPMSTEGTP